MVEGSSWFQKRGEFCFVFSFVILFTLSPALKSAESIFSGGRQRVAGAQVGAEAGVVEGKPGAPQGENILM